MSSYLECFFYAEVEWMESEFLDLPARLVQYPGKYYFDCEQEQLKALLPQYHGYYLVQLGIFDNYDLKAASTIPHQIYVGSNPRNTNNLSIVISHLSELPFQYESIDLFILPHTLEFCRQPDAVLNEIYNILIPGGKVLILGFNPLSLLGLIKLMKSAKNEPWCGKLINMRKVKFWLRHCGFSLEYQKTFCFRLPPKDQAKLNKSSWLEQLGQSCWPFMGAVYLLLAEKKVVTVTPVKAKTYAKKLQVRGGFPEPSTNKSL
jgi:SAM-dependent methyltransferase